MQNFAKFVDLNYVPGGAPSFVQGIKHGRIPQGTIAGGNGSFVLKGSPSKLILTVQTSDGKYIQLNIINVVRNVLNRRNITQNLCDKLENTFSSSKFEVSDGYITNLENIIANV